MFIEVYLKKICLMKKKKELRQKNLKLIVNSKVNIAPSCLFWKRNSLINKNLINKKKLVFIMVEVFYIQILLKIL